VSGQADVCHSGRRRGVECGTYEGLGRYCWAEACRSLACEWIRTPFVLHREGKEAVCFRFDEGGDDIRQSDICYYSQGHINQVHHLIDCILTDKEPRYGGRDGVHAVRCTLAAICSAWERRPVRVEEIGPDYTAYSATGQ